MPNELTHEVINEMKSILKFMENQEIHERELKHLSPRKQMQLYKELTNELELTLSYRLIMETVRNDPNTALGSVTINNKN
jgi:hypothetical protein